MRVPRSLLRQRVTVERYVGQTGASGPKYGTPRQRVPARITSKRRMVKNPTGVDVIGNAVADMRVEDVRDLVAESRLTYAGKTYRVLEVGIPTDRGGRAAMVEVILEGPR